MCSSHRNSLAKPKQLWVSVPVCSRGNGGRGGDTCGAVSVGDIGGPCGLGWLLRVGRPCSLAFLGQPCFACIAFRRHGLSLKGRSGQPLGSWVVCRDALPGLWLHSQAVRANVTRPRNREGTCRGEPTCHEACSWQVRALRPP